VSAKLGQWLRIEPACDQGWGTLGFADALITADRDTIARAIATFCEVLLTERKVKRASRVERRQSREEWTVKCASSTSKARGAFAVTSPINCSSATLGAAVPSRQMWTAVVHCISLPDRRYAWVADRELRAVGSNGRHETVVIFNIVSRRCESPSERRDASLNGYRPNGSPVFSGDSSSSKRGRMQTLKIVGVFALILLSSTIARAQGIAPGWQCSTEAH
jgi:hypothetical protein